MQRLIECAYHNLSRIRLIWSRLWAALAPHLVSAACHANSKVAAYAVDALRQLVAKLLVRAERAELTSFTYQDEALRPFVAVLKHCDSAAVREQTVQCIAQAITAHPRGLGSGAHACSLLSKNFKSLPFAVNAAGAGLPALGKHSIGIKSSVCFRTRHSPVL